MIYSARTVLEEIQSFQNLGAAFADSSASDGETTSTDNISEEVGPLATGADEAADVASAAEDEVETAEATANDEAEG